MLRLLWQSASTRLALAVEETQPHFPAKRKQTHAHKIESSGAASNGRLAAGNLFASFSGDSAADLNEWDLRVAAAATKGDGSGSRYQPDAMCLCAPQKASRALCRPHNRRSSASFTRQLQTNLAAQKVAGIFILIRVHLHTWAVRLYSHCTSLATMAASIFTLIQRSVQNKI